MTPPADENQVPRPGEIDVHARVLGGSGDPRVKLRSDDGEAATMVSVGKGMFRATATIAQAGTHRIEVSCGDGLDLLGLGISRKNQV